MVSTFQHHWFDPTAFAELTLDELLADPLARQLMTSDGVEPDEVIELLARMAKTVHVPPGDKD